jgi:hypothetical protein
MITSNSNIKAPQAKGPYSCIVVSALEGDLDRNITSIPLNELETRVL